MGDDTGEKGGRRPLGAAALGAVVPGLGHVYAGARVRALLWMTLVLTSLWVLGVDGFSTVSPADLYSDSPNLLALTAAVWLMNVVDAYVTAGRANRHRQEGPRCPNCGKELDSDLEFCHWCTTSLAETDEQ